MAAANGRNPQEEAPKKDITPTPGAEWRKKRSEGTTIVLPSGNSATVKPVPLDQLFLRGDIPDTLSPVAAMSLWKDNTSDEIGDNVKLSKDFMALIDIIVPLAMVYPRVVEQPEEGSDDISLDDIDFMDKIVIFNLSTQSAEMMRSFRNKQAELLQTAHAGEDLWDEAE